MVGRGSILTDDTSLALIREYYVPVALDQYIMTRRKDSAGDFYRTIVRQGPRKLGKQTTQGFYAALPDGRFLGFLNGHMASAFQRFLRQSLERMSTMPYRPASYLDRRRVDASKVYPPPAGGIVARVHTKILGGYGTIAANDIRGRALSQSVATDYFWATAEERRALAQDILPNSFIERFVRFHLMDNTRGEPGLWTRKDIRSLQASIKKGNIRGNVLLQTKDGRLGYDAAFLGKADVRRGQLVGLKMVARGTFWGQGQHTPGGPEGRFPLAVSLKMIDPKEAPAYVVPRGAKGWLGGYLKPR